MPREIDRLFCLSGSTAVVVGAASGIGKSSAALLAEAGATVVVADRDLDGAQVVAEAVRSEGGAARAAQGTSLRRHQSSTSSARRQPPTSL